MGGMGVPEHKDPRRPARRWIEVLKVRDYRRGGFLYRLIDDRGEILTSRKTLRHAMKTRDALEAGVKPICEAHQYLEEGVRLKMRHKTGTSLPYQVYVPSSGFLIRSFSREWKAKAFMREYAAIRAKMKGNTTLGSENENIFVDILSANWLSSDRRTRISAEFEKAERLIRAEREDARGQG